MSVDDIKKVINSLQELPAMPNVVTKALSVIKNPNSGARDLGKTIENDQAITVKLLKIINSSYFGLSTHIQTVSQAIAYLGFNEVKNIILSCAMKPMMTSQGGKALWEHSLFTAAFAKTIAEKIGRSDSDEAFAQGLLHDLGKIVFELYNSKQESAVKKLVDNGADVLMTEKMLFGFDHTEVGTFLANEMKLPKQIISVIKYHHKPLLSDFKVSSATIYLADKLVKDKPYEMEEEIQNILGISQDDIDKFKEQIFAKTKILLFNLNSL